MIKQEKEVGRLKSMLEDIELLGEVSKISTLGKFQVRKCIVV